MHALARWLIVVASLFVAGNTFAQGGAAQPTNNAVSSASDESASLEDLLRSHIRSYFGDTTIPDESLGISSINGAAFETLQSELSILDGGFDLVDGRVTPHAGASFRASFSKRPSALAGILTASRSPPANQPVLTVEAIGNGKGGLDRITRVTIVDGTRVRLRNDAVLIYGGGSWSRQ